MTTIKMIVLFEHSRNGDEVDKTALANHIEPVLTVI